MRTVLHILTRPADDLVQAIMREQQPHPETKVLVADLTGNEPDYAALVKQVFEANSVEVW